MSSSAIKLKSRQTSPNISPKKETSKDKNNDILNASKKNDNDETYDMLETTEINRVINKLDNLEKHNKKTNKIDYDDDDDEHNDGKNLKKTDNPLLNWNYDLLDENFDYNTFIQRKNARIQELAEKEKEQKKNKNPLDNEKQNNINIIVDTTTTTTTTTTTSTLKTTNTPVDIEHVIDTIGVYDLDEKTQLEIIKKKEEVLSKMSASASASASSKPSKLSKTNKNKVVEKNVVKNVVKTDGLVDNADNSDNFKKCFNLELNGIDEVKGNALLSWLIQAEYRNGIISKFDYENDTNVLFNLSMVCKSFYEMLRKRTKMLLNYQIVHFIRMRDGLKAFRRMMDTSKMGLGKTYITVAMVKYFKIPLVVFGPANTYDNWVNACIHFNLNHEKYLIFNSYTSFLGNNKPFIRRLKGGGKGAFGIKLKDEQGANFLEDDMKYTTTNEWRNMVMSGMILVLDECHLVKNVSKRAHYINILTKSLFQPGADNTYLLCLSATPVTEEESVSNLLKVMNINQEKRLIDFNTHTHTPIYRGIQNIYDFCVDIVNYNNSENNYLNRVNKQNYLERLKQGSSSSSNLNTFKPLPLQTINSLDVYWAAQLNTIYMSSSSTAKNEKTSLKVAYFLFKQFIKSNILLYMPPELEIEPETYNILALLNCVKSKNMIQEGMDQLNKIIETNQAILAGQGQGQGQGMGGGNNAQMMANVVQSLMLIEAGKITTFAKYAIMALLDNPNGKVVIMCNYINTISKLKEIMKDFEPMVIQGDVDPSLREKYKNFFQAYDNRHRLLIANISIVSQGINLDDTHGDFPRTLLVSPSYKLIQLHQATGRVMRAGTKSVPNINFIYIKDYEREINLLQSLYKKSAVLKDTLSYVVKMPTDYPILIEREDGELVEELMHNITKKRI